MYFGLPVSRALPALSLALILVACGGGGGGGSDTPPPVNRAPLVGAGTDQAVDEATGVTLTGSASDPDGDALTLAWTQTAGPTVTLAGANTASARFTAPAVDADTALRFRLTATDPAGASASDEVVITVRDVAVANQPPVANAGPDQSAPENTAVSLNGSGTDADGSITAYQWTQLAGPSVVLAGADSATATFTAPEVDADTALQFRLTVSDDRGASASDEVVVTVTNVTAANQPPVAEAGADQSVDENTAVTLAGSGTDSDGTIASYAWTQTAGPAVTLAGADSATARFTAPAVDADSVLGFQLTVTDDDGASASDTVQITVRDVPNVAPSADAGADQTVDENAAVTLAGSGTDSDGTIASYAWTQTAGPTVTLADADSATATFTAPAVSGSAVLSFTLSVTDDAGATASDSVQVTVNDTTTVAVSDASADEGTGTDGALDFIVRLSAAQPAAVTLDYASSADSAEAGRDYTEVSGSLSFAAGETEKTIRVATVADDFEENDEALRLSLSNISGAIAGRSIAVGTIRNDDNKGLLRAGAAKRSVTPLQRHIDGVQEARVGGAPHVQKFNLGGFGIDPTQNFPDPIGAFGDQLTTPAQQRVFNGSHGDENLNVRVLIVEQDDGTRLAFVTLDAVGAGNLIQKGLTAAVNAASCAVDACIESDNILFGQTHSHAGPDLQGLWGGVPQDWINNVLYPAAAEAAVEALQARRPARLSLRQGQNLDFNNYRRPRVDPDSESDGTLSLLAVSADEPGHPLGALLQYSAHPTSINENPRIPHADYVLGATDWVEDPAHFGGVALYYNGPIADASGAGSRSGCTPAAEDKKYGQVRCRGEGIAEAVLGFGERELAPSLSVRHETVYLPITNPLFVVGGALGSFNRYYDFLQLPADQIPGIGPQVQAGLYTLPQVTPTATTLVSRVTLGGETGGLEIVTIPGEATNTYGQYIRGLARTDTMLFGLTQNSFGYIIPEEEFSYIDPSGDAGFTLPFTGYEEFVSMGPLTAPLLRVEGYNRLFDAPPEGSVPPAVAACADPLSPDCIINDVGQRIDYIQRSYAQRCREAGGPEQFCALLNPDTPLREFCDQAGFPEGVCSAFGSATNTGGVNDSALFAGALDALLRGCDLLDTSNCLYPFPSDQFTVAAAAGSPQAVANGGTGRRVNFSPVATPRNVFGKPVDPTEWNRNDGFSPGALIATYVPDLSLEKTYGLPAAQLGIANIGLSQQADSPVLVLEVPQTPEVPAPRRALVWSELDANAGTLLEPGGEFQGFEIPGFHLDSPNPRAALLIRPAKNFTEGRRYVVVLRKLKNAAGDTLPAQAGFAACRDGFASALPPVQARCGELESNVFPVLAAAGIDRNEVYLAWDFTVASTENQIGRLRHMRDDAFAALGDGSSDCTAYSADAACRAPSFTVDRVSYAPQNGIARRIEGTLTVPSYLVPADASPLEDANVSALLRATCENLPAEAPDEFRSGCEDFLDVGGIAQGISAPPNRLFYNPSDRANPADPQGQRYGDGLPDRLPGAGTMSTRYICQIPAQASPEAPARPGIYGHGLLDSRQAVTYDGVPDLSREFNYMFCAVDWFGFATGDLPNVLSSLVDLSNFPVIPDASQQGMVNFMYLARLLRDPAGFASNPAFQDQGRPLFDNSEVFYDGNSQGGILGGVVLAADKDVNRGVLGSLGMNYSTLLNRSKDFDLYAIPLYASYTDSLDRQLLFSMIQMLWDRSENDGYAAHLTDNSAFGGPSNAVKLDPQFGDHQVTMWSAEVMARTMGVPYDNGQTQRVAARLGQARRHPDVQPYFALAPVDYTADAAGGALIVWDDARTAIPPIENLPPRPEPPLDRDPHDDSAKKASGRCQKAHFLRSDGRLIDITPVEFDGAACPGGLTPPAPTPYLGGGAVSGSVSAEICAPLVGCLADVPLVGGDLQAALTPLGAALGAAGYSQQTVSAVLDAGLRGCDLLDPSNCLYPFPSDQFTTTVPANTPSHPTGLRVNFSPLAMPRNIFGKPIDPTEWNRNDGFSPGAMIVTYAPGLDLPQTYGAPIAQLGIADVRRSLSAEAQANGWAPPPVLLLEVTDEGAFASEEHLAWAEMDVNADLLVAASELGGDDLYRNQPGRRALIVRPAVNLTPGKRYVVVLRNLKNAAGAALNAGEGFRACRDGDAVLGSVPQVAQRCAALNDRVFPVLAAAGIARDASLYLAWDFTVASAENLTGRLTHMRDDAFASLAQQPGADCTQYLEPAVLPLSPAQMPCAAPKFTVDKINPDADNGRFVAIEGTLTVPSYLRPADTSPADASEVREILQQMQTQFPESAALYDNDGYNTVESGSVIPPNRLNYAPDALVADPALAAFGDGKPDRTAAIGEMSTRFYCEIPKAAADGTAPPAQATLYGHGLLQGRYAITYDHSGGRSQLARDYNTMFCALDWFGFAQGDLPNVATALVDMSNFPVIPDASQQGMLNWMFLARALRDPNGFAANPAFRTPDGRPAFDRSAVNYYGNSQGGILPGPVVAVSKDVNRGVFGVPGMNYSTLLRRSSDFTLYSVPLYLSYPNELDRNLVFGLMQMLWDRGENDGYAAYLTPANGAVHGGQAGNANLDGQDNAVLLHPAFGDHQVSMYTAEVMARTMNVPADRRNVSDTRHPDVQPYYALQQLNAADYAPRAQGGTGRAGGGIVIYDPRANEVLPPPTVELPPRGGRDPHGDPRNDGAAICQQAQFLRAGGFVADVITPNLPHDRDQAKAACDALFGSGSTAIRPDFALQATPPTVVGGLQRLTGTLAEAATRLAAGDAPGAITALQAALGNAAQDLRGLTLGERNSLLLALGNLLTNLQNAQDPTALGTALADLLDDIRGLLIGASAGPVPAFENPPPQPLLAGAAEGAVRVPVGTPLGGYLRPPVGGEYIPGFEDFAGGDPSTFFNEFFDFIPSVDDEGQPLAPIPDELRALHSPYATYSPPSRGYYDSLLAKAVALYDGHDYVVLVKTDFIGMLDEVVQAVGEKVLADTGTDVRDALVMSATHTHDGPGAVANNSTRYFWLAVDAYQPEVFERLVGDLAIVVENALANLAPARFGYGLGTEGYVARIDDPANPQQKNLNSFRRSVDFPGYDQDANNAMRKRLGVLRVDRADGTPLALVMNYAAHGIAFDVENQYFSGDVLAAAEREVEQSFDTPVVAMLVQNTGGNISPRADGGPTLQRIERFGKLLAPQVRAIYDGIANFDTQPDLRVVSQRVILDRKHIGYPDTDGQHGDGDYPYPYGAAQCNNEAGVPFVGPSFGQSIPACLPAPPPDPQDLADNGVAENGAFVPQDTRVTAVRIGAATLLAQPGEPLSEYGVRLLGAAQDQGLNPNDTFIWGYSQDHVGYILADEKSDWDTGGTEGTTTFWGWKQGDRLLRANVALMQALRDNKPGPRNEFEADYFYRDLPYAPAQATPSLRPGRVTAQPTEIQRFQTTRFTFEGGDPVVDFPRVVMQTRDAAGAFVPARRSNGQIIDTFYEMHLKYRLVSGAHLWTVEFEAPKDWPAGDYRFHVEGKAVGVTTSYAVDSAAFAVKPSSSLQISEPARVGEQYEVTLAYTPRPGNYRLIDADVKSDRAAPVRAGRVRFSDGAMSFDATAPSIEARDGLLVAVYRVPAAGFSGTVTASGRDAFGNTTPGGAGPAAGTAGYGSGLLGALAQLAAEFNNVITALLSGDFGAAGEAFAAALANFADNLAGLGNGGADPGALIGLDTDPASAAQRALGAQREVEPVVLTGAQLPDWSVPAATGIPNSYPSGTPSDTTQLGDDVRGAHNGRLIYPAPGQTPAAGVPVDEIAAYAYRGGNWVEIPVQVDERMPYFLANANSDFAFYSGTDSELSYVWDTESWGMTAGVCEKAYDQNGLPDGRNEGVAGPTPDPVPGLDNDDEIVFMAADAGEAALPDTRPADVPADAAGQVIALADPLDPAAQRFVYLFRKPGGSAFRGQSHYVNYTRDADADQWIDRSFFADSDPQKLGTSNTGYGANLTGTVCADGTPGTARPSTDRFPRDGVVVTTPRYRWQASGRWMVRDIRIARQDAGDYGADLIDRWKGRAFQQSPDSTVSLVGFEDEQVNWEANSSLIGERAGPVRAIREVWGADSGTNVTKTETFYRDAVSYRYRVRVHPIPSDGLYTSWDYNRGAMVPTPAEASAGIDGGRYYTALRPQGVPIDGVNDDIGNVDGFQGFPAFFDAADPTFNLALAFDNWEQVSGKGDLGSLVYTFEIKGATALASPLVVPYYRDDACLDDGTGDDPVQRPYPGEASTDPRVIQGYEAAAGGTPYAQLACEQRQGAYASHGIHYFFTGDTDNAFSPLTSTEIDGQQWQFMVPTARPQNVGEPYANVVRAPLKPLVTPLPAAPGAPDTGNRSGGVYGLIDGFISDAVAFISAIPDADFAGLLDSGRVLLANLIDGLRGLLYEDGVSVSGSVTRTLAGGSAPGEVAQNVATAVENLALGAPLGDGLRVGVGVVDMTPDVGYCAGQYCDNSDFFDGVGGDDADPYVTAKTKNKSYGVQSRLTARAIVIEGSNGKRIALLKTDNYLAQDMLVRRVAQILQAGDSGIGYEQILYGVTHNHSAAYSSTLAWGVAIFEDAYDARFFENQARRMAEAIEIAAAGLRPARFGATEIHHRVYKGNVVRTATADDGTPAGYPLEYNDHGLVVARFDEVDESGDYVQPIAVWMNWGEHPESLDGYSLHSADFLGPLERYIDREIGAPLVFMQGDVGSAENTGNANEMLNDLAEVCGEWREGEAAPRRNDCAYGEGTVRDWEHEGYVQTERNVRFLADDVIRAWAAIGAGDAVIPPTRELPVDYVNAWVPGPASHPYPSVSNCRTEMTAEGNFGVVVAGLPDCARYGFPGENELTDALGMAYATLKAEGVPVPEQYDAPSFTGVEENLRLRLQAFRLGEMLLASCACEAQADLILNLETRSDAVPGNIFDGFDWACLLPQYASDPAYAQSCAIQSRYFDPSDPLNATPVPGDNFSSEAIAHMRAQLHNDARGWDAPDYVAQANAEPADPAQIKGNFTREEIQDLGAPGYKLAVGIGHAGDYNGYTVSYREYMNRDHYRKALTAYGPHTADYMVTRLVRMAAQMQGAGALVPEAIDAAAQADEARQQALSVLVGQAASAAYDAWHAALPDDLGPPVQLAQPQNIERFNAATFTWRGGTPAVDNPRVSVERETAPGVWLPAYDMTGEVQTRVQYPQGLPGIGSAYTGQFEWRWTANFEAYSSFPARLGSTAPGRYRFRVHGRYQKQQQTRSYGFVSAPFTVSPWSGVPIENAQVLPTAVTFRVGAIDYPRSYTSGFPFIRDNNDARICDECAFRPWAQHGRFQRAEVRVNGGDPVAAQCSGTQCSATTVVLPGQSVLIRAFDSAGNFGETVVTR